jgi:uncharacterized protein YndB with AHSA1/START domain
MDKKNVAKAEIMIVAPIAKVWEAITKPELVKQYLFGTDMTADWRVGGKITYRGEWEGKTYEDKGTILELEPQKRLVSTYWSSMSGLADVPENYKTVSYILSEEHGGTKMTIIQDNNATQTEADHSEQNWTMVLTKLKEVAEK